MDGHGHRTPSFVPDDPRAARIAALSEAWLSASAHDRDRIAEEIAGLIDGSVLAFPR